MGRPRRERPTIARPSTWYTYVRRVLAMAGAALAFAEVPDLVSTTGVIFIVVACVVVDREAFAAVVRWASAYAFVLRRLS